MTSSAIHRQPSGVAMRWGPTVAKHSLLGSQVLAHWHAEGHKALLFAQTQQMLDILEKSVQARRIHRPCLVSSPPFDISKHSLLRLSRSQSSS